MFAFNNAPYPAPPWHGFTLDWFLGNPAAGRVGLFRDAELLGSIWTSVVVASWVTALSVMVGTANAFLMERYQFPGKQLLSVLMLVPLVIPGVILGISILAFCSRLAELADSLWGLDLDFLRPGLVLVVLGQFSFVATIATLMISARLKRFDRTLEEAALNLGASQAAVLRTITFPYLRPALIGSAAISFLMSFENFNTTLMLVGRGRAAHGADVRPHARGRQPGAERGEPVSDAGLGAAGAVADAHRAPRRRTDRGRGRGRGLDLDAGSALLILRPGAAPTRRNETWPRSRSAPGTAMPDAAMRHWRCGRVRTSRSASPRPVARPPG